MPRSVLVAWLVSRAIVAAAFVAVHSGASAPASVPFIAWDGGWYADIAQRGYGFAHADGKMPYPFFPLLPAVLAAGREIALPYAVTGAVLSHAALLAALAGLHELVRARLSPAAATWAVFGLALFPGSAPFSMVYTEASLVAAAVWAFVAFDRGRPRAAGALAAVAALLRPNGIAVALSLGVAALAGRRRPAQLAWAVAPAALAFSAWLAVLWQWTGDPLVFLAAKGAWQEVSLAEILRGAAPLPKVDVLAALVALVALAASARRLPAAWLVFAALWLLPPLALGMLGMPRYVSSCFPVFAGLGSVLARARPAVGAGVLSVFAAGLALLSARIGSGRMMP